MRWETTVWMSAVLMVATSALNLPTEHAKHIVHGVSSPEDTVINLQTTGDKTENESVRIFTGPDSISSESENQENDNLIKPGSDSKSVEPDNFSIKTSQEESERRERSGAIEIGPNLPGSDGEPEGSKETTTESETTTVETDPPTTTEETTKGVETTSSETKETSSDEGQNTSPALGGDDEEDSTSEPQLPDTVVLTSTGRVRGHAWPGDKRILSYIDIKYGTFSNHFEAPKPPAIDEDAPIHNEKVHQKRCPQLLGDDKLHTESDCLTLSIFKPFKELTNASVLVHIHEGNFINESADPAIYGPEYLVLEDIILVLPNYRLGPLGFLCLQNETAPGNAALKDLALALKWIKENIDKFGGNPENIAVSGEGTAGALAGYLALSPMSKNNVNKVIAESGSVLSDWAIDRNPVVAATYLAQNIPGHWDSWQTLDIETLLKAGKDIAWRPCLESKTENGEHFMVETPWSMLQKANINVTWMIGSAKYAGVHESLNHTQATIDQLNDDARLLLPSDLKFESSEQKSRIGDQVKKQYFGETITLDNLKNRTLYYTDMAYLGPGIRTARSLASSGCKVYFYEFSFVGDFNRELEAVNNLVDGAVRGDIIGYIFYQEGSAPAEGSKERKMIEQLVEFWTSFLRTGKPSYTEDTEWREFEDKAESDEQWLSIDTETAMMTGVHVDRVGLWTEIYAEHFIDRSPAAGITPSVYTVLVLQIVFFITFFRNAWHFF